MLIGADCLQEAFLESSGRPEQQRERRSSGLRPPRLPVDGGRPSLDEGTQPGTEEPPGFIEPVRGSAGPRVMTRGQFSR